MRHSTTLSHLLDLKYFGGGSAAAADEIWQYVHDPSNREVKAIFTPNPEQMILAVHHQDFAQLLHSADVLLPDGVGLIWALQWVKGHHIPRASGVEVVQALLAKTETTERPLRALVVGGRNLPGAQAQRGSEVTESYHLPQVSTSAWEVIWTPGYNNALHPATQEEERVAFLIKKIKPSIVFVALGAPTQERWIVEHRQLLNKNGVQIAMAVGGTFDILTGKVGRAPGWLRTLNLEWLYRLFREPWRWWRQLRLIEFVWLTTLASFSR